MEMDILFYFFLSDVFKFLFLWYTYPKIYAKEKE